MNMSSAFDTGGKKRSGDGGVRVEFQWIRRCGWGHVRCYLQCWGCEINESKWTIRRAMDTPSHCKLPTARQSASNSNLLYTTRGNIQGEEPDRKLS